MHESGVGAGGVGQCVRHETDDRSLAAAKTPHWPEPGRVKWKLLKWVAAISIDTKPIKRRRRLSSGGGWFF